MSYDRKPRSLIDGFRNRSRDENENRDFQFMNSVPQNVLMYLKSFKESISKLEYENEAMRREMRSLQLQVTNITNKLRVFEDQVDSPKLTVWERVKVNLLNRPPIDELKRQKIYKNEECFNTELYSIPMDLETGVPKIVVLCCSLIEKHLVECNTQIDDSVENIMEAAKIISGIYRTPGDCVEIQKLRYKINESQYDCLEYEANVNTIASLLKLFFFELKTPLLRDIDFLRSLDVNPERFDNLTMDAKINALKSFIDQIPELQYKTLKYFILHLTRLTFTYNDLINSKNLAISIGPSIIRIERHFENLHSRTDHFNMINEYLDYLIQYSDYIFLQTTVVSTEV